jgi:peptide deformylase
MANENQSKLASEKQVSKLTKEDIITLPHADLRRRSQKVGMITQEIIDIVEGMQHATLDWEASREHEVGVALAAVQLDIMYRIVVLRNNFDDKNDRTFSVFINPQITKYEGVIEEDFEGCLSIRDVYGKVPRHSKVRVKALNLEGREVRVSAEGFLARIFQHEVDHTNGIVFIDHIRDNPDAYYQLTPSGKLQKLDYEKDIRDNVVLWESEAAEALVDG